MAGMIAGVKLAVLSVALFLLAVAPALSQIPFYQGKTITVIRGGSPGGVGDMRTRAWTNHLKKHIPGNPTIIIEFMPGGGGQKASNHLFRGAPTAWSSAPCRAGWCRRRSWESRVCNMT